MGHPFPALQNQSKLMRFELKMNFLTQCYTVFDGKVLIIPKTSATKYNIKQNHLTPLSPSRPFPPASNRTNPNASLDEYVDILQVQQLLLENSSNSTPSVGPPAPSAPAPPSLTSTNGCSISSSTTTTLSTAIGGTSSTASTAKNRPKVNVQKASEYSTAANQLQGTSPLRRFSPKKKTSNNLLSEALNWRSCFFLWADYFWHAIG